MMDHDGQHTEQPKSPVRTVPATGRRTDALILPEPFRPEEPR